jgi:hypothetical protein
VRLAVLLLLAALGGFLLGRLTAPEAWGPRGPKPGMPAVAGQGEPALAPAAPAEHAPRVEPATEGVVQPSGPMEPGAEAEPAAEGRLMVDFQGVDADPRAFVGSRLLNGAYDEYDLYPDEKERVLRDELAPGVYYVWWLDAEGHRRGGLASVEAGKLTCLHAAGWKTAPPIPDGLGVLDVEVTATWGGGLPCDVHVGYKAGEETAIETSSTGHGSAILYPGRYSVWIGSHTEEVVISAGQATGLRIAHEDEGDIILDMGNELVDGLALARPDEAPEQQALWTGKVNGIPRCGLVYLAEGEYDVLYVRDYMDGLGVPLGHAVVQKGHTTWLRCQLPSGGLELRVVVPPSTQSQVCVAIDAEHSPGQMTVYEAPEDGESRSTVVLAPGRYRLTVSADGCETKTVAVDVAGRMVDLSVELLPAR